MVIKFLAEAYKDYSETEYVLRARKLCDSRKDAEEFLKDKCQDLQYIREIECN